jgi:hypothetical protein
MPFLVLTEFHCAFKGRVSRQFQGIFDFYGIHIGSAFLLFNLLSKFYPAKLKITHDSVLGTNASRNSTVTVAAFNAIPIWVDGPFNISFLIAFTTLTDGNLRSFSGELLLQGVGLGMSL